MNDRKRLGLWALGAAALAGLLRLPSLNLLLDRDEGEYATLAWLWRTGKGVPYRDWLEQKPPLAVAFNAVAQTLFQDGVLGLRLLSLAWILLTVLALLSLVHGLGRRGRLGARLRDDGRLRTDAAGLAAVAAALLLSATRTQSLAANTETWQTLPLIGALAVLFLPGPDALKARHYLGAGLLLGVASLFKQPVLVGVLFLPWAAQSKSGGLLRALLLTMAGTLAAWLAAVAVFAAQGAGWDLLQCTIAYNQGYVAQGWTAAWRRVLGLALALTPELGAVAALAGLGWLALGRERADRRWLAAWLGVGLAALAASGRFYPHYAVLLLAPLAVLAGFGLMGLLAPAGGVGSRLPRVLRLALAGLAVLGYLWCSGGLWLDRGAAERTLRLYHVPTFVEAPQAAAQLQRLCPPDKKVFLWGDEAELYYLSQREPATRFLFTYPFTGEAPAWPGGDQELLAGLHQVSTGAAVLAKPLDYNRPAQQAIFNSLTQEFSSQQVGSFMMGARLR